MQRTGQRDIILPWILSILLQLRSRKSARIRSHCHEDRFQRIRRNITKTDSIWSRIDTARSSSLKEMRGEERSWNDRQGEATQICHLFGMLMLYILESYSGRMKQVHVILSTCRRSDGGVAAAALVSHQICDSNRASVIMYGQ